MSEATVGKTYYLDGGYFRMTGIAMTDKGERAVGCYVEVDENGEVVDVYERAPYVDQLRNEVYGVLSIDVEQTLTENAR